MLVHLGQRQQRLGLFHRRGIFQPGIEAVLGEIQNFLPLGHGLVGDIAIDIGEIEIDIGLGEGAGQRQPRALAASSAGGIGAVAGLGDQVCLLAPEIQIPGEIAATWPNQRQVPP